LHAVASGDLASAAQALDAGETRRPIALAHGVLARALQRRDRHLQACASLLLAHAFVLRSRLEVGLHFGARAAGLFNACDDARGEAEALSVQSYCASALARTDEALAAAHRGIVLRADRQADASTGAGFNYLGIAAFWAGDFAAAHDALDASAWYGRQQREPAVAYQPTVNACFAEVLRIVHGRREADDRALLDALVAKGSALRAAGAGGFARGSAPIGLLLLDFGSFFLALRRRDAQAADAALGDCAARAAVLPRDSWVRAIPWWARMERSEAAGDRRAAVQCGRAMAALARAGEHESLAALARQRVARLLTLPAG
jgi:hypothetical protein